MSDIHFPRSHFLGGMRRLNGRSWYNKEEDIAWKEETEALDFLKVDQWFQRDESLINELKIGIFRLVKCKRSK